MAIACGASLPDGWVLVEEGADDRERGPEGEGGDVADVKEVTTEMVAAVTSSAGRREGGAAGEDKEDEKAVSGATTDCWKPPLRGLVLTLFG